LNELVIIGQEFNEEKVRRELEACLLNEEEIEHFQIGRKFTDTWRL
jgi:hypothetical protein